ncbi:MAG: hypothetical protein ABEJ93_02680 [Candidatus Nanohalobium sp.]
MNDSGIKAATVLVAGLLLVGAAASATINFNIDIIDFGGSNNKSSNQTQQSQDTGQDKEFTWSGKSSDRITQKEVEKSIVEEIVTGVVKALFG